MLCAWALKSVGTNANFNFLYGILIWLCDYGPINLKLQLLPPKATHGLGGGGKFEQANLQKLECQGGGWSFE